MPRRRIHIVAVALAVMAALSAPAAAQQQDLRSPDARDVISQPAGDMVDLRSPDAADPYSGVPVKVVVPAPVVRHADAGFDWRDAGIGAAVLFALVLTGSAIVRRQKPAMG